MQITRLSQEPITRLNQVPITRLSQMAQTGTYFQVLNLVKAALNFKTLITLRNLIHLSRIRSDQHHQTRVTCQARQKRKASTMQDIGVEVRLRRICASIHLGRAGRRRAERTCQLPHRNLEA